MAGLITDLIQTSQSLDAQQLALQVTGNNLANVNNPNYARQSVVMGSTGNLNTPVGEISMGVIATGIQQTRDPFLDAQVTQEVAQTGTLQAQLNQLQQAQADLGEQVTSADTNTSITSTSQSTTGISSALSNFFNAASQLSSNPTETSAKQSLLQSAQTLASTINTADSNLSGLQASISTQITQDTGTVNGLLQNIATLNGQIQEMNVQKPNSANDLVDQRQADLEQLAGYMNFTTTTIPNGNGQIDVNALDANSNPVNLVDKTTVAGAVNFTGSGFTFGTPATTLGLTGGSLVGDLTASTGAIQTLRNQLATTASQLTTAINTAYNPTNATGNFFQSTPAAGQLLTLDPTLTVDSMKTTDTGNAGANELALAVAQVSTQNFSTSGGDQINGTITGYYSQAVTGIGQSIDGVTSQLTDQTTVQQMVQTQRDSVSGVNENEELTNLLTYQRAFQAQARMMNTINDCLDIVVNGLFGAAVS
jgi:flagellar hook-associated protein 1 FlgK